MPESFSNAPDQPSNEAVEESEVAVEETNGTVKASEEVGEGESERVSKLIARAGIASRRAAEELIVAGRVSVNGHFLREPGIKADPYNDKIVVDGQPLPRVEKPTTVLLLHKPKYTITSRADDGKAGDKRATVLDLLPRKYGNLHPIGRLDYETTGVLLLTDDGELTHLLTHPSHGIEKVYEARVRGEVTASDIETLRSGVYLEDGKTAPAGAKVLAQTEKNALVQLTLREGKNRQVRRMMEALGHPVTALRRTQFAGVKLEGLPPGEFRVLLPAEIKMLFKAAQTGLKASKRKPRSPSKSDREIKVPAPSKAKNLRVGEARARVLEKSGEKKMERKSESETPKPLEKRFTERAKSTSPRAPIERPKTRPVKKAATAKRIEKRWKD